jgi:hypothetical protein
MEQQAFIEYLLFINTPSYTLKTFLLYTFDTIDVEGKTKPNSSLCLCGLTIVDS